MKARLALGAVAALALLVAVVFAAGRGCFGEHEAPGRIAGPRLDESQIRARSQADLGAGRAIGADTAKQVLFGDLHVHTTISFDAFTLSLPLAGGEGAHPPADACDFARYCSGLDFWSINDHALSITPRHWAETVDSVRQCNDVAGDPANPDVVAYLGWEWTHVGLRPEEHYGHKNVVLRDLEDDAIPTRPIAALRGQPFQIGTLGLGLFALRQGGRVHDLARFLTERSDLAHCADGVPVRDLPLDCTEVADSPDVLFEKLDDWGHASLVIPHGTAWGFYTPPGSSWDKQLVPGMHDPERQGLIEVYSGHGNAEPYRDFRGVVTGADGEPRCPEPSADYLPSCWRAGEIIAERCRAEGLAEDECEARAAEARALAVEAGVAGHLSVPGESAADWLDAGQCRDCDQPAFNYRPASSTQYILARGARMGFIASSDNHFARPGTGFKEVHRRGMTESRGPEAQLDTLFPSEPEAPDARSRAIDLTAPRLDLFELERQASFFTTGGLVAAHSEGRDRDAIWHALERREVYGTSGPRILLWFDLLNAPASRGARTPMGSAVELAEAPVFQVRAVGSFEQKPGCPDTAHEALGAERLSHLCLDECYHPGEVRRPITRIELVRIRPGPGSSDDVADRIDDPWRVIECEPDPAGCAATVFDAEFPAAGQDTLYYARVFEAEKPGINAANLRCERDAEGNCLEVDLCPGPEADADDCLAPHEPRAWSSPIYVDHTTRP